MNLEHQKKVPVKSPMTLKGLCRIWYWIRVYIFLGLYHVITFLGRVITFDLSPPLCDYL